MSVLTQRAVASRAFFDTLLSSSFRKWLDENAAGARDDDGDIVALAFADWEPAGVLVTESGPHRHPAVMCTLHDGRFAVWVLGASLAEDVAVDARDVPVDDGMTVGDVVDHLASLPYGAEFVLAFAGERRVASLAPAA